MIRPYRYASTKSPFTFSGPCQNIIIRDNSFYFDALEDVCPLYAVQIIPPPPTKNIYILRTISLTITNNTSLSRIDTTTKKMLITVSAYKYFTVLFQGQKIPRTSLVISGGLLATLI